MLLNISVTLFLIGLYILVWDRAAMRSRWDDEMKVYDWDRRGDIVLTERFADCLCSKLSRIVCFC